jgi:hypothetical protein
MSLAAGTEEASPAQAGSFSPYCVCRRAQPGATMVECSACGDWFHTGCVGLDAAVVARIEAYHCPACALQHGPSTRTRAGRAGGREEGGKGRPSAGRLLRYRDGTLVRRQARQSARARRRRDYAALDEGQPSDAAPPFEALLRARRFLPAPVAVVDGATLTADVLRVRGFVEPMMVAGDAAAMGMAMPPAPFTVDDVVRLVGNPHPPPPPHTHTRPGVTCAGVVSRFADAEVGQGRAARCP